MPLGLRASFKALTATTIAGLSVFGGSLISPVVPAPLALLGPIRPAPPKMFDTAALWRDDPTSPPDPHTATPGEIAAFFASISPSQAQALTRRFPEIAGDLDGTPTALRYAANQAQHPDFTGRQIIAYDERGDGRIVEVFGDLGAADRVVVLVPGADTRLDNFDNGLGNIKQRAPAWQAMQLYERIRAEHPSARVAIVAWLGYDPPEGMGREVLREDRAAAGAESLTRFVDGVVLGHPTRSVVVIGHSYGSAVAGLAASSLSRQVTDLVAIGSPGMGVSTRSALPESARVWACTAPDDWIRRVPGVRLFGVGHGRLPSDPEFGALPLPCDDVEGHDGYFVPGTAALQALTAIAVDGLEWDPR